VHIHTNASIHYTNLTLYNTHNSDIIGAAAAEEVASALLELGAAVDRDDANDAAWSTPLHNAIASENPALVRLLLQVNCTSFFVLFFPCELSMLCAAHAC
jgi:hypothetical protein